MASGSDDDDSDRPTESMVNKNVQVARNIVARNTKNLASFAFFFFTVTIVLENIWPDVVVSAV